jgi:hypothetical protein
MINDYLVRRSAANHNNVAKEFMRPKINSFAIQNQASHLTAYFILSFSFYGSSEAKFPDKVQAEHCLMLVVRDCVFLQIRVSVQANMIGAQNGQSRSEPKSRGRFTGEQLLRERPRVYRKVVELLAEPGMSINQITKLCRVSEHTVRAVRKREGVSIAERKQRLMSIFGNVAELGAERMEELAPHATLRDAGMAAGIAIDKLLALLGETGAGVPVQINMHAGVAELLHKRYNELVRQAELSIENKKALPNGETISESPAAMDLQSTKELPKSE